MANVQSFYLHSTTDMREHARQHFSCRRREIHGVHTTSHATGTIGRPSIRLLFTKVIVNVRIILIRIIVSRSGTSVRKTPEAALRGRS